MGPYQRRPWVLPSPAHVSGPPAYTRAMRRSVAGSHAESTLVNRPKGGGLHCVFLNIHSIDPRAHRGHNASIRDRCSACTEVWIEVAGVEPMRPVDSGIGGFPMTDWNWFVA